MDQIRRCGDVSVGTGLPLESNVHTVRSSWSPTVLALNVMPVRHGSAALLGAGSL
jgi:hypothetical protein